MNKLKILTIVYDLQKGGTQRAAQVFAEAYKNLNHDSRILSVYTGGSRYDEIKNEIKIWLFANNENLAEIQKWQPDILHIHSHGLKAEDVYQIINKTKNEKTKIIETNVFSSPSVWEEYLTYSFQLNNWASWLYLMRGGNINKIKIIPYPINTNNFKKAAPENIKKFKAHYNIPDNAFVLGRIGQSYTAKWSNMLISIFNDLAKKIAIYT